MSGRSLDINEIAKLVKKQDEQEQEKRRTAAKKKVGKTEPRDYDTWYNLKAHFGDCANPECIDPRDKTIKGTIMVYEVNGSDICRYCFLAGVNKTPS